MRRMPGLAPLTGVLAASAVALAIGAFAALATGSPLASSCAGAGPNHAALVVEHGDGSVVTRCVSFGTAAVTGEWLLDSSGVSWSSQTFGGFGAAVCAVDAEPAHYSTCPGRDSYWAVFVSRGGGDWQLASVGISSLTLGDGDAEGFRYVPAAGDPAPPAPATGVCSGAGSTAVATARATAPSGPAASPPAGANGGPSRPDSGFDLGPVSAVLVGGALATFALLRLFRTRRHSQ